MVIIRNLFSVFSAELIGKIVSFVTTVYLARILQPEGFGILNFAAASAGYFMLPVNFGFNDYGILKVSPDISKQNIKWQIGNVFGLRLAIALVSFSLLVGVSFLVPKFHQIQHLFVIFGLLAFTSALSTDWLFTAIERMEFMAIGRIVGSLLYFVLIFIVVKSADDLIPCGLVTVGRQFIVVFLMLAFLGWKIGGFAVSINGRAWRDILRFVLPIGLSSVAAQMYFNIDLVILGFIRTPVEVGYYSAALRLVLLGVGLRILIGQVIYPKIVRYSASSKDNLQKASLLIEKYCIILGLLIGIIGSFFGKSIIEIVYGPLFSASVLPFQISAWVIAIGFMGIVFPYILLSVDKNSFAKVIISTAILNLILNFILIPPIGILGAAVSFLGSTLYNFALCYYFVQKKVVAVNIKPLFYKPLVAAVPLIICPLLLSQKLHFLLVLPLGLLLYFGTLALQGITPNEFKAAMKLEIK